MADFKFEWAVDGDITVLGGQFDAGDAFRVFVFDRPVAEADKPHIEARMRELLINDGYSDGPWRELAS